MTDDDRTQAIFGSLDGLTSTVAVVIASLLTGTQKSLIGTGFSIAIAASVGMAWSEWDSDKNGSIRRAVVMGVATLITSALPVIPFVFLWKTSGVIVSAIVCVVLLGVIAELRASLTPASRTRAILVTVGGTLIVSVLVTILNLIVAA